MALLRKVTTLSPKKQQYSVRLAFRKNEGIVSPKVSKQNGREIWNTV